MTAIKNLRLYLFGTAIGLVIVAMFLAVLFTYGAVISNLLFGVNFRIH